MKRSRIRKTALFAALVAVLAALAFRGNTALELNTYTVSSPSLPEALHGFRIAQVSDLHNAQMGKDNERLLALLRDAQPDIIAITGDLVDSRRTDVDVALDFTAQAVTIAPCYYVPGNHESRIPEYETLKEGLAALGVTVLEDSTALLELAGASISLLGVKDPSFDAAPGNDAATMTAKLQGLRDESRFTLLLSHRPELMEVYAEAGMDCVLTGHAHGGQIRLPFLGGILAPNQGFFPAYDSGLYTQDGTAMLVSRGIGNSLFPLRINNRPEVLLVILETQI